MLRSQKIESSYYPRKQRPPTQRATNQLYKNSARNKYWKPNRRVINSGQLLGLIQYSLLLFLFSMNTIHQTETNTRNIFNKKVDLSWSQDNRPIVLRASNGVEKFMEMNKASEREESEYKFKVSPTRIKFSSAVIDGIDRKIIVSSSGSERLSRGHELRPLTGLTPVGFSDKRRCKSCKQMAPAYELWPDTSENKRYMQNSEENLQDNNHAGHDTNLRMYKFHQDHVQSQYNPKFNINSNLNLKSLRGLLPKPLPVMTTSYSTNRVLRERSTPAETEDEAPSTNASREELDSLADENIYERPDKARLDRENSDLEIDYEASGSYDDGDRIYTKNPNHQQINFQVLDSKQALKRAQSRRLKESQIYPPGDPSRLYADALLVYVKDFNRYIKT